MKNKRIWELDFLRGFAIIMMVFDHLMYDLGHLDNYFGNFYSVDLGFFNWINELAEMYWTSGLRFVGHYFFIGIFLLVSGISFTFSRNNLSRSLKMLIVAVGITLVTWLVQVITNMHFIIVMGVIHMYAISTFLTYLIRKVVKSDLVVMLIGLAIIIIGIELRFWDFTGKYITNFTIADYPALFIGTKAYGVDYFSVIPYAGVIMIGTVIGNKLYANRVSLLPQAKVSNKNIAILAGKYSIHVFLLHQIVLFLFIFVVGFIFGYRL